MGTPKAAFDNTEGTPGAADAVGAHAADGCACRTEADGVDDWGLAMRGMYDDDSGGEEGEQARAVAAEAASAGATAVAATGGQAACPPNATAAAPGKQQQAAPGKPAATGGQSLKYTRMMKGSDVEIEPDGTKIVLYESVRRELTQTLLQSGTLPDRDQGSLSAMLKQGKLVALPDDTGGYTVVVNKVTYGFSRRQQTSGVGCTQPPKHV